MREELAILHDRFAALSGAIGPVLNRLGDDMESISTQLQELMVLQAQTQLALRQSTSEAPLDESAALDSVLIAYRQLQDLRLVIVQEMSQREPTFRFYHCIVYRELIVQALRQQTVRVEQLVALSRQTILQKTLRSGGDCDFSARMVDEQAELFGGGSNRSWIGLSIRLRLLISVNWWARRAEGFLNRHKDWWLPMDQTIKVVPHGSRTARPW